MIQIISFCVLFLTCNIKKLNSLRGQYILCARANLSTSFSVTRKFRAQNVDVKRPSSALYAMCTVQFYVRHARFAAGSGVSGDRSRLVGGAHAKLSNASLAASRSSACCQHPSEIMHACIRHSRVCCVAPTISFRPKERKSAGGGPEAAAAAAAREERGSHMDARVEEACASSGPLNEMSWGGQVISDRPKIFI